MPDAVEAAGNAAQGIHERVSAPDGEDGVLLAKALRGADYLVLGACAKVLAHPSARGELYEACQQASASNGHLGQKSVTGIKAMMHVLHAHGNSHGQGYHPQVEGSIGYAGKHPCKGRCEPAHQYDAYKGQEQKRENLQHYLGECCPEGNVAILVNQRYHGGDEQRSH